MLVKRNCETERSRDRRYDRKLGRLPFWRFRLQFLPFSIQFANGGFRAGTSTPDGDFGGPLVPGGGHRAGKGESNCGHRGGRSPIRSDHTQCFAKRRLWKSSVRGESDQDKGERGKH